MESKVASRIEAYVAALEAPLAELPTARREEFLAEARAHLGAIVEARRADGMSEEGAWDAAMTEFGEPDVVGRALWREWAKGAQLESEGEPLSKWQLAKKFVPPSALVLSVYGLLTVLTSSNQSWGSFRWWGTPYFIVLFPALFGVGAYRARRGGMRWTPSNVAAIVFGVLQYLLILAQLQWPEVHLLLWSSFGMVGCWVFCRWLYKRDLSKRPWQTAPPYKQNAVAAEQTYRIGPLIGWTVGSVMTCIGTVKTGLQFFGWTHTLIRLAVWIFFDVAVGFYLWKRR